METPYDWITIALFCGLAILYLQRSMEKPSPHDRVIYYLPPALGLALTNWLGNNGYNVFAVLSVILTVAFILVVLNPFPQERKP